MRSVVPFGAFVELLMPHDDNNNRHHHHHFRPWQALVHASAVSEETSRLSRDDDADDRRRAIEFFAPVGSRVWVKIVEVKEGGGEGGGGGGGGEDRNDGGRRRGDDARSRIKISASMRAVSQQDGADLDPDGKMLMNMPGGFDKDNNNSNRGRRNTKRPMSPPGDRDAPLSPLPPRVGSVLRARVSSNAKFGAFVLLEGFAGKGLVHITQIAEGLDMARLKEATDEEKEAAVREMMPVGSELFVKIVEVVEAREDEETGALVAAKVSCSAKVVDQATGEDLDPTGERAAAGGGGGGGSGGKRGGGAAAAAAGAAVGASAGAVARQGDAVEWGHLAAERYKGASGRDYDLVAETPEEAATAAAAAVAAEEAAVRAEEELLRAGLPPPPPPPAINSVEAALAVLEQLGGGGGGGSRKHKRDKRKKDKKKKSKSKKKHHHHRKDEKKRRSRSSKRSTRSRSRSRSTSSSSSSSGSE